MTKSYDDAVFVRALPNGTIVETAVERELFGSEKSWGLQDPTLRKAKRPHKKRWQVMENGRSEARELLAACRGEEAGIAKLESGAYGHVERTMIGSNNSVSIDINRLT
jgi:hypothetical protein